MLQYMFDCKNDQRFSFRVWLEGFMRLTGARLHPWLQAFAGLACLPVLSSATCRCDHVAFDPKSFVTHCCPLNTTVCMLVCAICFLFFVVVCLFVCLFVGWLFLFVCLFV